MLFGGCAVSLADYGADQPVASVCGPASAKIACVSRFGSLLPPSFVKDPDPTVGYAGTVIEDDPSWKLVSEASFVVRLYANHLLRLGVLTSQVFNKEKGLEILGDNPKIWPGYLPVLPVIHEAPIYVPGLNKLFTTQDGPPGNLSNVVIDLNTEPPTVDFFVTDPPVYQPTGGILHDNMIYWAVQGNNQSLPGGLKQRPGVVRVDPKTYKAEWLVNNFYGFYFGGLNDLTVDPVGDIWFTDSGMCAVPR